MKNKKLLYVLIPVTILVWGTLIYKIMVASVSNVPELIRTSSLTEITTEHVLNDTFSINPHYRDPFSGKAEKKVVSTGKSNAPPVKKILTPATSIKWPEIIYNGIVKNQKSNKQMVMMQINGMSTMMKIAEISGNIQLNKVYKDSIEVQMGKEKKFIRK
ncbi:MAG: hypothetical protein H0X46_04810 [Bacteroidetes bacterium]|nr:hypothetical protein [Bacteroidota bacterium]